jgi:hypothetical protein
MSIIRETIRGATGFAFILLAVFCFIAGAAWLLETLKGALQV